MPYNAICQNSLTVPKIRKENSLALFRRDASLGRTCLPLSLMDFLKTPFCERCWNDFQTMQPCSAVIELEIELPATEVWRRDLRHVIFFYRKEKLEFQRVTARFKPYRQIFKRVTDIQKHATVPKKHTFQHRRTQRNVRYIPLLTCS